MTEDRIIKVTEEELGLSNINGQIATEVYWQNRCFRKGLDFSKKRNESILKFCQKYVAKGSNCLLVEHQYYIAIWIEKKQIFSPQSELLPSTFNENEQLLLNTKNKSRESTLTILNNQLSDAEKSQSQKRETSGTLEPAFLDLCQKELAELIGPIASVLCQRTLAENPRVGAESYVETLAKHIPDLRQAEQFHRYLVRAVSQA